LNELSFDVRSKIQEEVHGVTSLEFVETPIKITYALEDFETYVTESIPHENKQAYTYAIDELKSSYVKDHGLRLSFLRADLFDIPKACVRYTSYLEIMLKYFGPEALRRPIRFDNLTKSEQDFYRAAYNQILPSRDRSGRLVVFMKGTADIKSLHERVRINNYTHGYSMFGLQTAILADRIGSYISYFHHITHTIHLPPFQSTDAIFDILSYRYY
jgi:hypothetical protein